MEHMKTTDIDEVCNVSLCGEDFFQTMLIREREKCEKQGHQFMLVVLDVGSLFNDNWKEIESISRKLSMVLTQTTRDIDIKGWYLHNMLIGIIYPGLYDEEKNAVLRSIKQSIQTCFNPLESENIKSYTIFFPTSDEHDASPSETKPDHVAMLQGELV
jgi:hypothetical protein